MKSKPFLIWLYMLVLIVITASCTPPVEPQPGVPASQAPSQTQVPSESASAAPPSTSPAMTAAPTAAGTAPQATEPVGQGNQLAGTFWTLVSMGTPGSETPVVAGSNITLQLGSDGEADGFGGCNSYGGQYQVSQDTITFQQIIHTEIACVDQKLNQQEQQYFQALGSTGKYMLTGGSLVIFYNNGQSALNFTKAAPSPAVTSSPSAGETSPSNSVGATSAPQTQPAATGEPNTPYLDDRSTPTGLVQSYFNAINRKEYLRAYTYYRDPATTLGSYDKFQQGYANTDSVDITLGQIGGDAGAGQLYYSVPVLLKAHTTDGKTQDYAACYILHLARPELQAVPPFIPLNIERGKADVIKSGTSPADALASACSGPDYPAGSPINPAPVTNINDISKNNYLDDRSGPVEVLSSLFNAINRKEYARAYSYWEANSQVPPFDQFQNGYANTESVQLTTGQVSSDHGAGQIYYSVPSVLTAKTTSGSTQTFAGCYKFHLANPQIQATPPFIPLSIMSAQVKQVANNADVQALLTQACK